MKNFICSFRRYDEFEATFWKLFRPYLNKGRLLAAKSQFLSNHGFGDSFAFLFLFREISLL